MSETEPSNSHRQDKCSSTKSHPQVPWIVSRNVEKDDAVVYYSLLGQLTKSIGNGTDPEIYPLFVTQLLKKN